MTLTFSQRKLLHEYLERDAARKAERERIRQEQEAGKLSFFDAQRLLRALKPIRSQ